jgi:hypothetical protein
MITVHCNTINNTYGEAIQQLEQKTNAFRKSVEHLRTLYGDLLEDIESGKRFTKLEQWHTARETFESLRESEGYDFVPPEDRKPYEDNYKKILKEGNEAHDSYMEKLGTDRINEAVDEMNKATERFEKQAIDLASTIERHKKNANEKNMTAER